MKRFLYIVILLLACGHMRADKMYNTVTNVYYAYYSGQWINDSYLSPLTYDGWNAGIGGEWWKESRHYGWRKMGNIQALGGKTIQSQHHNSISCFDVQGGWGMHRYWLFDTGRSKGIDGSSIEVYVGPYAGLDFQMKSLSSNVNKPYSFDAGIDVELMAGASYRFRYKKSAYRLIYEGRINTLGAMWLPDYWQSYYETTEKINLGGSISFSYPGNRQFIHQQLAMDFQFRKYIWRIGMRHEYLHYGDKERHFARQSVSIVAGIIFDTHTLKTNITNTEISF